MRPVKAVRTRQGPAVPLRIEFLMTRLDLVNALAWEVRDHDLDEPLPVFSPRKVLDVVRDVLFTNGNQFHYWGDSVLNPDQHKAVEQWAEATVERVFGNALAEAARRTATAASPKSEEDNA